MEARVAEDKAKKAAKRAERESLLGEDLMPPNARTVFDPAPTPELRARGERRYRACKHVHAGNVFKHSMDPDLRH